MVRLDGNPHDGLIKFALKDPVHAAAVLRTALPRAISEAIDWSTLAMFDPEAFELVAEHAPDFRFIVDDLGTQDDAALRARALTELATVALVLLRDGRKTHDLFEFFGPWLDTFRAVAAAPDGFNAMIAVLRYVSRVTQVDPRHVQEFARHIGPQTESANMTAAEQIAQEAEARGIEQGRRGLLLKQVALKFGAPDPDTLRVLERATSEQLSECAERILTATSVEEVLAPCR